jgi:hypothetical protein
MRVRMQQKNEVLAYGPGHQMPDGPSWSEDGGWQTTHAAQATMLGLYVRQSACAGLWRDRGCLMLP